MTWGCVSSAYTFLLWWSWECVLYLIIIIKPEAWIINHCLELGHETMVCAVCLTMFLWKSFLHFWLSGDRMIPNKNDQYCQTWSYICFPLGQHILEFLSCFNPLRPRYASLHQRTVFYFLRVMPCYLRDSYYDLRQCWIIARLKNIFIESSPIVSCHTVGLNELMLNGLMMKSENQLIIMYCFFL